MGEISSFWKDSVEALKQAVGRTRKPEGLKSKPGNRTGISRNPTYIEEGMEAPHEMGNDDLNRTQGEIIRLRHIILDPKQEYTAGERQSAQEKLFNLEEQRNKSLMPK